SCAARRNGLPRPSRGAATVREGRFWCQAPERKRAEVSTAQPRIAPRFPRADTARKRTAGRTAGARHWNENVTNCPQPRERRSSSAGRRPDLSLRNVTTETLQVTGIRCERCVLRLAKALEGHEGLEFANANLMGQVVLEYDEQRTSLDALLAS